LDKANLAADLCIRSGGDTGYTRELLEAYGEFTTGDVLETLAGSRSVSGFPTPDEQQVEKALAALKVSHAKAAVACVTTADSPSKEMTEIVEVYLGSGEHAVEHLLDLIIREYDAWSEPHLATIKEQIEAATSAYRQGDGPLAINQIVKLLSEWDDISQPVQLLEESKGHEEPRSKEIYRIVRDFCLWLANENGHYEEALAISRALLETFPELPAVAAQLSQDVDALESLAEEAKSIKLMEPLIEAQEAVQGRISDFDADLAVSGFGPKSRGLAKRLYDAFADVAARTVGTGLEDMPWMVVRGLAIDLNNKHESREGACAILKGLISHKATKPSKAVVDKLNDDQRTLRRNLKWEELNRISGDVPKGISLVSELLDGADAEERAALLQLKTALERKRAATVRKRVFWGLAAAAFVGFLIYDANKKTSYSPRLPPTATFTPSTPQPSSPPSSSTSPQLESPSSQFDEQMPPPGINNTLNRREVRYCVFQGERLNILRELTTNNQEIGRFNGLVDDYNSRCSSFRYRQGVLQTVEAEVPGKQHDLRMDVQLLLTSWRRSPTSPSVDESIINTTTASGAALVQSRLKELGYYAGAVDGIWGPASRTALRNFKLAHSGLGYDDRWDLATQKALMGR
jgi:Putative peptidoglycan binding domain